MGFFSNKITELHPESVVELQYWSKKWGISIRQLNEAIVDTGSTNVQYLKMHLKKNKIVQQIPFLGWVKTFTAKTTSPKFT